MEQNDEESKYENYGTIIRDQPSSSTEHQIQDVVDKSSFAANQSS